MTATWTTYPYKGSEKGFSFGAPRTADSRRAAAQDRNDICREGGSTQRAWTDAITYGPNRVLAQTQASPIA